MNALEMECERCNVSNSCKYNGLSPVLLKNKQYKCQIIGGYGNKSVDREILSEENKKLHDEGKTCLTLVYIPFEENGAIDYKLQKVFSPPVVTEREKPQITMDSITARNSS